MNTFEFDGEKSQANLHKHGIDFHDAQDLWQDQDLLEIQAKSDDEPRYLVIGLIGDKHWSAVITYRGCQRQSNFDPLSGKVKLTHP